MPRRLAAEDEQPILQAFGELQDVAATARATGRPHQTVVAVLTRNGIDAPVRGWITEAERSRVVELYQAGMNAHEISIEVRRSYGGVRRIIREAGVERESARARLKRIREEHGPEIIDRFRANPNLYASEVAKEYGVNAHWIRELVRGAGINADPSQGPSTYEVNEAFFDDISTPDQAYVLGLLTADGSISADGVKISLMHTDADLLVRVLGAMDSTHPVRVWATNPSVVNGKPASGGYMAGFTIKNQRLQKALKRLGYAGRKEGKEVLPEVDSSLERHLLRGVFDGDGSFYWRDDLNAWHMQVSIGEQVCRRFQRFCMQVNPDTPGSLGPVKGTYKWGTGGPRTVAKLAYAMYADAELFLTRKALQAQCAMEGRPLAIDDTKFAYFA